MGEGAREGSLLRLFGPAVIASFSASILGFIFWVVAARLYSPAQVGVTGSTISLVSGIGMAAAGGLYAVLLRVLPAHETPRRLLWVASAAAMVFAALVGLVVGILHLSRLSVSLLWLMIPLAASVWSFFTLQDSILLSLRKTRVLFLSNVGFGLAKLLLLVAFGGTALGIAGAWLIPLLLVVPIVALVADRALASATPTEAATMKVTARHVLAEYWNSFAVVFAIAGVPIVATLVVGGTFSGLVYVCWTVYIASDQTSTWLSNAIVVTATERSFDVSRAVRHGRSIIPAMLGGGVVAIILAPLILAIFGSQYAAALPLLRLLFVAFSIRVLVGVALAGRRIQQHYWLVAGGQSVYSIVVVGGAILASRSHSLFGIGLAVIVAAAIQLLATISRGMVRGLRGQEQAPSA